MQHKRRRSSLAVHHSVSCRVRGVLQMFQFWKILIVSAESPQKFPNPLSRIQFWTVGRQEEQFQAGAVCARYRALAMITTVFFPRRLSRDLTRGGTAPGRRK